MSLNEKKRHKQLPDIYLTEGICRSKSFAGLSHRRTNSADATFSSSGADPCFDSCQSILRTGFGAVFGQSTARNFIHGLSSAKSSKLHKAPRPERMQIIFDSISKGLKDSILLAQNDISSSRVAFDNVSVTSVLQVKVNERLLKKLEFHLSKIEELKEQYDVQHRMRDGIRAMAYAYILSAGKEKESALQSVKMQFKECTELMCSLENKLEELMGTFLFEMKGIQGFARICAGDVFEVVIRHGDQKWKSRGRVVKNGEQLWENKFILFKSLFNEPLCIKAVEVRGLGKNILLGNKFCEIQDLFSAHPQQMTINLNPSGSLKLNLIITWNPLNCADGMNMSTLPSSAGMPYSYGRNSISQSSIQEAEAFSELSLSAKEGLLHNSNFCDNTGQSFSSESTSASVSAQSSAIASPDIEVMSRACHLVESSLNQYEPNIATSVHFKSRDPNLNDSQTWSVPPSEENSECHSISSSDSNLRKRNLTEVLKSVTILVDDVLELYPELNEFSSVLDEINRLLKGNNSSSSGSNISISVESALGCFDFLNSAIDNEEFDAADKLSEDISTKITEQSTASDMQMVSDEQKLPSKLNLNSLSVSSGNDQIDAILTDHLLYCTKLITILITRRPSKTGENRNLIKLQKQIHIFTILSSVMKKNNLFLIDDFFEEDEHNVKHLWISIAGDALYCMTDQLCSEVENIIKSKAVLDSYMASIVCPRLVCEILDLDQYDSCRVSVLQFKTYFSGHPNPDAVICEFVADTLAAEDLKSRDIQRAFAAVSVLSKINPSSHSLFLIGCLLTETDVDLKNISTCYLKAVASNSDLKKKVISTYIEMLASEDTSSRIVACAALNVLDAKDYCTEQLMHIAANDDDATVREAANSVLCSLEKLTLQETS